MSASPPTRRSARSLARVSVLAATLLATTHGAYAGAIPFDTFLQFGFNAAGTAAVGCDPADNQVAGPVAARRGLSDAVQVADRVLQGAGPLPAGGMGVADRIQGLQGLKVPDQVLAPITTTQDSHARWRGSITQDPSFSYCLMLTSEFTTSRDKAGSSRARVSGQGAPTGDCFYHIVASP